MRMGKRLCSLLLTVLIPLPTLWGQTQHGYVKTKGRLNEKGLLVHGSKIPGATVQVKGRTAVLSQDDGSFSFPIPSKSYYLQDVQKKGYVLTDPETLSRPYAYSTNPLVLVLETQGRQADDNLAAERRVRRNLQKQLQAKEDEIEALKQKGQITEEKYRELLETLYSKQENNEKLISLMAKKYAQMDYDQMDSTDYCISAAILDGRLTEADSLLRAKGDMQQRLAEIRMEQRVEAQEEMALSQRQKNLETSKAGTRRKIEDTASDCYKFFDRFCMTQQYDSAAFYLNMRSELDTTNINHLLEAIEFEKEFVNEGWEVIRSERAMAISREFYGERSVEYALCCNRMGEYLSEDSYKTVYNAAPYLDIAHHILDSLYGEDHLEMARCYMSYGRMYKSMSQGIYSDLADIDSDINAGKEYALKAVQIYKRVAPNRLLDIAKGYMLLAELSGEGDYRAQALTIYKSINKGKNAGIAEYYFHEGWGYYKTDEYFCTPNSKVGYCFENTSKYDDHTAIRKEMEKYKKSIPIFRHAQSIYRELYGENYPMVDDINYIIEQIEEEIDKFGQALKSKKPIETLYNIW